MKQYDQTLQKQTGYACTVYSMLNIIKYDYGIELKVDWILKIVVYMEKIGVLFPKWAVFSVIYPAMTKLIEMKTGFKLNIKKSSISSGLDNKSMWGLWFKKASRLYKTLSQDWQITKEDIEELVKAKGWYGHNHAWKLWNKTHKWIMIETLWGYAYTYTLDNLQRAEIMGLYYDTARTLVPWDSKTLQAQKYWVKEAKKRKQFIPIEEVLEKLT